MRIRLKRKEGKWFAWHPVVAEQLGPTGVNYKLVIFETVERTLIRAQGIVQWKYVIK